MSKSNSFQEQVAKLMKEHDGVSLILDHYGITAATAAEHMVDEFFKGIVYTDGLKEKLKVSGEKQYV